MTLGILFPAALSKSRPLRNLRRLRPIRVLVLGPGFSSLKLRACFAPRNGRSPQSGSAIQVRGELAKFHRGGTSLRLVHSPLTHNSNNNNLGRGLSAVD